MRSENVIWTEDVFIGNLKFWSWSFSFQNTGHSNCGPDFIYKVTSREQQSWRAVFLAQENWII
jgi:hypothetical protein